jgi:hypothetical protein
MRCRENFTELAEVYKQLNAPVGKLGRASLVWSNRSVTGTDKTYAHYLKRIGEITEERNEIASQIKTVLNNAEFQGQPVGEGNEDGLGHRAKALIDEVTDLAEHDHDRQD